jgi:hypothetical protein
MRNVNLSLFDSSRTIRANVNLSLSKSQDNELKEFIKKAGGISAGKAQTRLF